MAFMLVGADCTDDPPLNPMLKATELEQGPTGQRRRANWVSAIATDQTSSRLASPNSVGDQRLTMPLVASNRLICQEPWSAATK
jgi:hypothetical protein